MEATDSQLLEDFVGGQSDEAFGRLVGRYIHLIHAAAMRQVRDTHLADDVTQAALIVLARRAASVPAKHLAGWLLTTTRLCAKQALRAQTRRAHHEHEAATMQPVVSNSTDPTQTQVVELLDEALSHLRARESAAVAMRFLQNRPMSDVAAAMGVSVDAAQKVVSRSLIKLRAILMRRGLVLPSTALLSAALVDQSAHSAPAALAASATSASGQSISIAKGAIHMILWAKIKAAAALLLPAALVVGTGVTVLDYKLAAAPAAQQVASGQATSADANTPDEQPAVPQSFGVASARLPIKAAAGKRIHYSGYIHTDSVTHGYAGLWMRIDGKNRMLLDNMYDRGAKGTTPWTLYEISLDVPTDAKAIWFGVLHPGEGTAWFDSLRVEIDGKPYADNNGNLDFESPSLRPFWFTAGAGYELALDTEVFHTGKQSLRSKLIDAESAGRIAAAEPEALHQNPTQESFGVAWGNFPIEAAAGKHIKYSGYIRTEAVTQGSAGLWWRADGGNGQVLAFDNMQDRGAKDTTPWTRYEISLDVPINTTNINFGVLHPGNGTAWFDSLQVEIDGKPYQDPGWLDLDFESPTAGPYWHLFGAGYELKLDQGIVHTGKQSLRSKLIDAAAAGRTPSTQPQPESSGS